MNLHLIGSGIFHGHGVRLVGDVLNQCPIGSTVGFVLDVPSGLIVANRPIKNNRISGEVGVGQIGGFRARSQGGEAAIIAPCALMFGIDEGSYLNSVGCLLCKSSESVGLGI